MRKNYSYSGENSEELLALLKARRNFLKDKISIIEKWKHAHPDNYPICVKQRGKSVGYYIILEDSTQKYISVDKRKIICQYAQASYYSKVLTSASAEFKKIDNILKYYPKTPAEKVFANLTVNRQNLVTSITSTDEDIVHAFLSVSEKRNKTPFRPEGLTQKTEHGEMVRSKSEQLIANCLYHAGIPYDYERPVKVGNISYIPDFTMLNVRERKLRLWEHLGKMDNPEYAEAAVKKINNYIKAGFYPWDNLILTYETAQTPLDSDIIKTCIKEFCL